MPRQPCCAADCLLLIKLAIMYERKIPELLDCGLAVAIKAIGGKWGGWKDLEDCGMIFKKVYAEVPARVEYWFTEVGESVLPVVDVLEQWGNDNKEYLNRKHTGYEPGSCAFLQDKVKAIN